MDIDCIQILCLIILSCIIYYITISIIGYIKINKKINQTTTKRYGKLIYSPSS